MCQRKKQTSLETRLSFHLLLSSSERVLWTREKPHRFPLPPTISASPEQVGFLNRNPVKCEQRVPIIKDRRQNINQDGVSFYFGSEFSDESDQKEKYWHNWFLCFFFASLKLFCRFSHCDENESYERDLDGQRSRSRDRFEKRVVILL